MQTTGLSRDLKLIGVMSLLFVILIVALKVVDNQYHLFETVLVNIL